MDTAEITWDATTETLQTVLSLLDPAVRAYVLGEMKDFADQEMEGSAEQYEIATQVAGSDHIQDGW